MRRWDPLNDRQLAVLQRVAGGDDLHDSDSPTRQSADALRDRGLLDINRRGGWQATLTDAGAFYIEHGHHPDRPTNTDVAPSTSVSNRTPRGTRPRQTELEITAQQLIDRLQENAGVVTVVDPEAPTRAAWRRAIHAAKEDGLLPRGHHLRHRGRDTGDLRIELVKGEHPDARHWAPRLRVDVPNAIGQVHPLVAKLQRRPGRIFVTEASLNRALRILNTLLTEWERRGNSAELEDDAHGITMICGESRYGTQISEQREVVEQYPTSEELEQKKVYAWQRVQPTEREVGTGYLVLELKHEWKYSGRRRRWADRARWTLESKLTDVLAELEARAQLDEERRIAKLEEEARRQQDCEAAMATARFRFAEDVKIKALTEQVDGWEQAARIRAYCDALQAAQADANSDVTAWIEWARTYADRIDPLRRHTFQPGISEPRPQDLKPYLGRWSPYGPDARY
ncbi:hypothetical protein JOF56_003039 [Kibdelosporangium banguiense]|uniref:Uncharacterized protein n=1 Tax=Kibdelosporangium banguiense TaxID=1365924 RepID=A0ABS4TE76_9PSEU|nr:hypothetical protein [Kibdelosporangium banguiense]MBP2322654.1 hypothetical protein [Kibdelosporangium banguiense]